MQKEEILQKLKESTLSLLEKDQLIYRNSSDLALMWQEEYSESVSWKEFQKKK